MLHLLAFSLPEISAFVQQIAVFLVGLSVTFATVVTAWKKTPLDRMVKFVYRQLAGQPLSDWFKHLISQAIAPMLEPLTEQIADIHHETTLNNGSSIKDAVNRIEKEQAAEKIRTTKRSKVIDTRLDRVETVLMKGDHA